MLLSGGRGRGGSTVDDSEGVAIGSRGTSTSRGRGGEGAAVAEHRVVEVGVGSVDVLRVGHCEITRQHTVAVL
jgi:hypothetical protein